VAGPTLSQKARKGRAPQGLTVYTLSERMGHPPAKALEAGGLELNDSLIAPAGLQSQLFLSGSVTSIDQFSNNGPTISSHVSQEAARQCALGNPAACFSEIGP